jgi:hypothetical protein
MTVNYNGFSCKYDAKTDTYSRPPVKVRFPCAKCGADRPEKITATKIEILDCPCASLNFHCECGDIILNGKDSHCLKCIMAVKV